MGSPSRSRAARADSMSPTISLRSTATPAAETVSLKASRSSARWMTAASAPIISTP